MLMLCLLAQGGLWGIAKFNDHEPAPFAVLLECLSSVLRQLITSEVDVFRFVGDLQLVLGEHLQNIPLLYSGCPVLSDILSRVGITANGSQEEFPTRELRDRFVFLVAKVFLTIAQIRPIALFLDDLHDAPPSYGPAPTFICEQC